MPAPFLSLILILAATTGMWRLSTRLADVSIVDIFWGPGFLIPLLVSAFAGPPMTGRDWLMLALVTLWAARLSLHVYTRWKKLGHEDYRYNAMRKAVGPSFPQRSLVTIFTLQGVLLWVISWPLQAEMGGPPVPFGILDFIGIALFAIGFFFEAVGDYQLTVFRDDPANTGKVLNTGVWAWSRHPNYFGEATLWWGFFFIALGGSGAWWSVVGPLVITFLLLRVSGVTMLEEKIVERRPAYADYIRRTSVFIPMPPKTR
ncbi:MAG TPA: DUF1295 domain-containing protein [Rhizomicrobium sp.]|jgi:steroid 5-alpha reductase family enzyme|nr:DUF1295 domain-containing protein [Rhizomicrobium sp.]